MTAAWSTWEAPGPGDWWLAREHLPYPVSRMFWSVFPPVTIGWKVGGARYGLPTGEPRWARVNTWVYYGPQVPLTAEELADRALTAAGTPAAAPWREEVRRWYDDERPQVVGANRVLQDTRPALLEDGELQLHLAAAARNVSRWGRLHFEHTGFDLAAGFLLEAARGWGSDPASVIGLLAGSSPASSAVDSLLGDVALELDRSGSAAVGSLAEVRAAGPDAAAALDRYLDQYGWRLVAGHDVDEPTTGERPDLVVATIGARRGRPTAARGPDPAVAFRERFPAGERARFDRLLTDARASYGLRDDDVGVCWNWPLGLLRRAALELGRRLVQRGLLHDERHVFEADVGEAVSLLGIDGPPADELAERWERRRSAAAAEPPPHLDGGPAPDQPGPVELPPAVARLAEIRDLTWFLAPHRGRGPLGGVGVGTEVVVGPARLVRDLDELSRLAEGDILVAVTTTAGFTAVFPLLRAVVTEYGGLLSHTAILARELDVTAVVGVADALDQIRDGDVLEVDPAAGSVRVVQPAG